MKKLLIICFQQNWFWVFLVELAVSSVELHFGEVMMSVNEHQLEHSAAYAPTKESAKQLANCLNR